MSDAGERASPGGAHGRSSLAVLDGLAAHGAGLRPTPAIVWTRSHRRSAPRPRRQVEALEDATAALRPRSGSWTIARRAGAQSEVDKLDAQLDELNARIAVVRDDLADAQIRARGLVEELQDILGELDQRLEYSPSARSRPTRPDRPHTSRALSRPTSFNELSDRYAYYEAALDADSELVEEIEVLRDETEDKRSIVEERRQEIAPRNSVSRRTRSNSPQCVQERASMLAGTEGGARREEAVLATS